MVDLAAVWGSEGKTWTIALVVDAVVVAFATVVVLRSDDLNTVMGNLLNRTGLFPFGRRRLLLCKKESCFPCCDQKD